MLFEGRVHVYYAQVYVESAHEDDKDMAASFARQRNGLCGAAVPGSLWLITGLHTGEVDFTVELLDSEPAIDPSWEEAVEASFVPRSPDVAIVEWAGQASYPIDLPMGSYRVRYVARGMAAGRDLDILVEGDPVDAYRLTFWPAPAAPDAVLRQTSDIAAYWHQAMASNR
jgi:hypothetical protein